MPPLSRMGPWAPELTHNSNNPKLSLFMFFLIGHKNMILPLPPSLSPFNLSFSQQQQYQLYYLEKIYNYTNMGN